MTHWNYRRVLSRDFDGEEIAEVFYNGKRVVAWEGAIEMGEESHHKLKVLMRRAARAMDAPGLDLDDLLDKGVQRGRPLENDRPRYKP